MKSLEQICKQWPTRRRELKAPNGAKRSLAIIFLGSIITSTASAGAPECMADVVMRARMSKEGFTEQIGSVQVYVDLAKKAKWDRSEHDFAGQKYSGADVYKIASFSLNPSSIRRLQNELTEKGMPPSRIEQSIADYKEYAGLILKERFLAISTGFKQLFVYSNKDAGAIVTIKNGEACILLTLDKPVIQHFSLDLPSSMTGRPSRRLLELTQSYRKENGFGVALYSKTPDGDTVVLVAKPQLAVSARGNYDGPVPYYFSGALLLEKRGGEVSLVGDLMHTMYIGGWDIEMNTDR